MKKVFPTYETFIWAFLVVVTCLSWKITDGFELFGDRRIVACAILIIAFIKTRFVLLDFMELRHAPTIGRLFGELWWAGNCILLLGLYWSSSQPSL